MTTGTARPTGIETPDATSRSSDRWCRVLIVLFAAALFLVRLTAPSDLPDNDQESPASYVLDATRNGHWMIQRNALGQLASKPPLYTWLAGLVTLAAGKISRFTLYLPGALAVCGTALLIFGVARRYFGAASGFLGACSFLFCQYGFKHVALARTDALFTLTVAITALVAFSAWTSGRGWSRFWLAGAVATLTKGPAGMLLGVTGVVGIPRRPRGWGCTAAARLLWPGVAVYALLVGTWFALAWREAGSELVDTQLKRELVAHAVGGGKYALKASELTHPLLYFASRYAPWSLFAGLGFWRVFRRPALAPHERSFERFLFAWFGIGLVGFTLAAHKRPDLLLPILPPAAMLAGRELARLLRPVSMSALLRGASLVAALGLAAVAIYEQRDARSNHAVAQARAMQALAAWMQAHLPAALPVTYADNAMTLQFHLNQHQLAASPDQAARLLQGDAHCAVVVRDVEALRRLLPGGFVLHELAREPREGPPLVSLVSNRPLTGDFSDVGVAIGPVTLRLEGMGLKRAKWTDFEIEPRAMPARATLVNDTPGSVSVRVTVVTATARRTEARLLKAGESWTVEPPKRL